MIMLLIPLMATVLGIKPITSLGYAVTFTFTLITLSSQPDGLRGDQTFRAKHPNFMPFNLILKQDIIFVYIKHYWTNDNQWSFCFVICTKHFVFPSFLRPIKQWISNYCFRFISELSSTSFEFKSFINFYTQSRETWNENERRLGEKGVQVENVARVKYMVIFEGDNVIYPFELSVGRVYVVCIFYREKWTSAILSFS